MTLIIVFQCLDSICICINKHFNKTLKLNLNRATRTLKNDRTQNAGRFTLNIYYKISTERTGTEKCLTCGSDDFILLDKPITGVGVVKLKAKEDVFYHPSCGGQLLAKEDPLRLNCIFSPLIYTIDGLKVKTGEG